MNSTICSTVTLIGIHVVVGGWKSHVFAIQNTKAAICMTTVLIASSTAGGHWKTSLGSSIQIQEP